MSLEDVLRNIVIQTLYVSTNEHVYARVPLSALGFFLLDNVFFFLKKKSIGVNNC